MKRALLNCILGLMHSKWKLGLSGLLAKWSKILIESSFCGDSVFELNGEKRFLENPPIPLKNVIDGGANRGEWSDALIEAQPSVENLFMVEPNAELEEVLRSRHKNDSRIEIISRALDYRVDKLEFVIPPDQDSHAGLRIGESDEQDKQTGEKIETTTIDELVDSVSCPSIDLLKLDLDGFDYYALLGARRSLVEKKVSIIQFEVTRSWEDTGASPCSAFRYLEQLDFKIYRIAPSGLVPVDVQVTPHFSIFSNFCAIRRDLDCKIA